MRVHHERGNARRVVSGNKMDQLVSLMMRVSQLDVERGHRDYNELIDNMRTHRLINERVRLIEMIHKLKEELKISDKKYSR